jgi:hypothetical protein
LDVFHLQGDGYIPLPCLVQNLTGNRPARRSRYCILTVGGAPLSVLKPYIEQQERPE